VDDLLAQRAASIRQRHEPSVILEGSGTFVADHDGPLDLPSDPALEATAEHLRQGFLPERSPRWFAVVDGRGRVAWTHKREVTVGSHGTIWAHYEL
jgi:2,5-diamino-6-(ribosylamino)-4(3H)-pyrimidinone 5'-phosphate reductase